MLSKTQNVAFRTIQGQAYIVNTKTSMLHELDEVGTCIWENLNGKKTVDELARRVSDEYAVDFQTAKSDLIEYAVSLKELGVVCGDIE